ncbi:hypothetical protein [Acidovorax sp. LjRoot194]|uniref:hypothetical protein n=1 Tax=Acidovorax sp. LjRoot194 TaxID=3342280 RepID=UPI003ECC6AA1
MSSISGIGGAQGINVQGMDLETAMMAVQSNRANLLEAQLKDQISSVQAKNDQISKLNQLLGSLNKAAAGVASDAKAGDKVNLASTAAEIKTAAQSANITLPTELGGGTKAADANKGQLDGFIQQVKSQIDSMSNSQQMDMLRLQSLSNKRNEAFDVMTNFIKKMQDSRSSIIGNMR